MKPTQPRDLIRDWRRRLRDASPAAYVDPDKLQERRWLLVGTGSDGLDYVLATATSEQEADRRLAALQLYLERFRNLRVERHREVTATDKHLDLLRSRTESKRQVVRDLGPRADLATCQAAAARLGFYLSASFWYRLRSECGFARKGVRRCLP